MEKTLYKLNTLLLLLLLLKSEVSTWRPRNDLTKRVSVRQGKSHSSDQYLDKISRDWLQSAAHDYVHSLDYVIKHYD